MTRIDEMNSPDHQLLSQYVDGELNAEDAEILRRRLAVEPELHSTMQRMQQLNQALRDSYGGADDQAVPDHIKALLQAPSSEVKNDSKVLRFPTRPQRHHWAVAIAASLVAAFGLVLVQQQHGANNTPQSQAQLLSAALESTPSLAEGWHSLANGSQLRPLLSFNSDLGQWCREYILTSADSQWRGVACRQDSGWQTKIVTAQVADDNSSDVYRPAGTADSTAVNRYIDKHAEGIALSQAEEAELIARNWKAQ